MTDDERPQTANNLWSAVSDRSSLFVRVSIYAVVLVAFFLRAYRLADQNVWWDEGWSIWLSQKDLAWIALRTAMDEHPPLHYWMLHFWNFVAGTSAFAGRFLSLAFGVLTIALLYRIGKRAGGAWMGVLAALFLATARFHIWWSQDIKNYTSSIFFAFAAVWFGLEILDFRFQTSDSSVHNSPFAIRYSLFAYALCAALALWTHYLAALVLITLNVYALGVLVHAQVSGFKFQVSARRWQHFKLGSLTHWRIGSLTHWLIDSLTHRHTGSLTLWLIANALAAALFAPWLFLYLQNAAAWTAAPAFDFVLFLKLVATVLPLGITTNIDDGATLTVVFTALVLLGVRGQGSEVRTRNEILPPAYRLLPALIVALPPLLVYVLSLTPVAFFAPKIQARYLLVLLPAYVILLALGVQFLARFSRVFALVAILFVLGANAFVLNDYYAARRLRDEYTTLANTINAFARQGDLVLLDTDQEWPTFLYYLRAPLDWLGVPNGKTMTADDADTLARRALARHDAIWLVTIPDALATDPQKLLETRLARALPKQLERAVDGKRLVLYAQAARDWVHLAPENFAPQYPRTQKIHDSVQLLGFDLPTRELNAGDTLRVVTYWRTAYPAMVSVRVGGLITTTLRMPSGDCMRYEIDFALPPDAAGEFPLQVDHVELARLRIAPRAPRAHVVEIPHRVDYRLGDAIHLVGHDLPTTNLKPGETLNLTLYWRAERPIETSYTVFAQLVGAFNPRKNNPLWGQVDRAPALPTNAWLPDEILADTYRLVVDADAPPGKYTLIVGMYDAATGARLAVDGGGDSIVIAEILVQ